MEILVVLAIALLLLGPTLLPKFARSLGQTQRELRALQKGLDEQE